MNKDEEIKKLEGRIEELTGQAVLAERTFYNAKAELSQLMHKLKQLKKEELETLNN